MSLRLLRAAVASALFVIGVVGPVHAGQVRVNVVNFGFNPSVVNVNVNDHVIWVWGSGTHTVTSGDSAAVVPDGTFDSGSMASTATGGPSFTYQPTSAGIIKYYCTPHAPFMAGRVITQASGAAVSDFRITEVQFNVAANQDLIEISNFGAAGDLGLYRLKINGTTISTIPAGGIETLAIASGARLTLHLNASGTNTATDQFFPGIATGLPATGSVALFVPSTISTLTADKIIDFVQWGAGGQENEALAASAGLWGAGQSIDNVADGHSIEFCGQPGDHGAGSWSEVSGPNFGTNGNCLTPNRSVTWGRVKVLYR